MTFNHDKISQELLVPKNGDTLGEEGISASFELYVREQMT